MKSIGLVLTGESEHIALDQFLRNSLSSDLTFKKYKIDGFTSGKLILPTPGPIQTKAEKLIGKLIEAAYENQFAILVDDLEIEHIENPKNVIDFLKETTTIHLEKIKRTNDNDHNRRVRESLTRCSIHFLSPMLEAYFFADSTSLLRAGVPAGTIPQRTGTGENFEVSSLEEDFLTADDVEKSFRKSNKSCAWQSMKHVGRHRHPKHYLQYLCLRGNGHYQETKGGSAALRDLSWPNVAAEPVPFLASLIEDLAEMIDVYRPIVTTHPLTNRSSRTYFRNC